MRRDKTGSRRATIRIIIPAVLLALLLTATTGSSFTALYVFGDSLSDTGRNPAPAPEYYEGRYSNGPLWVEYLSAELGIPYNASNNFAVSGSTTSNLLSQIAGLTPSANLQSGLFTVVSGGNDFLDNSPVLGVNDPAWGVVVSNAVMNLTNALSALYAMGAREVVIGNLANVGQTPSFLESPLGYAGYVDSKVALFNARLASALTNVALLNPGLRLYAFNNNLALSNILAAPASFGFTVTTNGALEDPNLTNKSFAGPGADYVFWDVIHPTTKLHALTAAGTFQYVSAQLSLPRNGAVTNLTVFNLYPGLPYTVQSSTNLLTWSDYQSITPASTNATVLWTNGPRTKLFYRVRY
ncbi:MAG: SGNH/GDSL hydrolase family protein [Verrucomicrobiota bacterium]|jgi:phospholipase/lecithinase/hemolysin